MTIEDLLNYSFSLIGWMKAIILVVTLWVFFVGMRHFEKPDFYLYLIDMFLLFFLIMIVSIIEISINGGIRIGGKVYYS